LKKKERKEIEKQTSSFGNLKIIKNENKGQKIFKINIRRKPKKIIALKKRKNKAKKPEKYSYWKKRNKH